MARYTAVARTLHWVIALLIVTNLLLGFTRDALPDGWAVTLVRIGWRLAHPAPPLPAAMPGWEKGVAHATHVIFYALMLILPLSGWIMSSAGSRPINWFFLFDVPKFAVAKTDGIVGLSHQAHESLPWAWVALLLLHIGAALRHHFVLKDDVLRRMI